MARLFVSLGLELLVQQADVFHFCPYDDLDFVFVLLFWDGGL
jgi:hypothetical protein